MIASAAISRSAAGILGIVMLAGACSRSAEEAWLDFRITHFEHLSGSGPPLHLPSASTAAEGGDGRIRVSGTIRLPDHCDVLQADLEERRPEIDLRLRPERSGGHDGPCDESDRSVLVAYTADIQQLPPGQYRLRVLEEEHVEHARRWWTRDPEPETTLLHEADVRVR